MACLRGTDKPPPETTCKVKRRRVAKAAEAEHKKVPLSVELDDGAEAQPNLKRKWLPPPGSVLDLKFPNLRRDANV